MIENMPPYYHKQPPVKDLFGQGPIPDRPLHSNKNRLVKKIRYALSLIPAY